MQEIQYELFQEENEIKLIDFITLAQEDDDFRNSFIKIGIYP